MSKEQRYSVKLGMRLCWKGQDKQTRIHSSSHLNTNKIFQTHIRKPSVTYDKISTRFFLTKIYIELVFDIQANLDRHLSLV